ncbi:MAG TPA: hypothetical protein VHE30_17500 [Polyangiaceae bacterium]|nr:hypothetical protein [Polyangiaceae bacterium]
MAPPSSDRALEETLVRACSEAAAPRACVLAEGDAPHVDARVSWESPLEASVRAQPEASRRIERRLRFHPEDGEVDRWKAAGLVVAALATSAPEEPPKAPGDGEVAKTPPRPPRLWIGGGGLTGRGLVDGPARFGGFLRLAFRPTDFPVFLVAELQTSAAPAGPSGVRPTFTPISLGLGGAFEIAPARLAVRPRLDGVVERLGLSRDGPPADSGGRVLDGLRFGLELAYPTEFPVALVLGLSGERLSGGTAARVGGHKVTSFPADSYALLLGLEAPILR